MHLLSVVAINKLPSDLSSQFSFQFTICGFGNYDVVHGLYFITHSHNSTILHLSKFLLFIGLLETMSHLLNFFQHTVRVIKAFSLFYHTWAHFLPLSVFSGMTMAVCGVHTQIVPGSLKVTNSSRGKVNLLWILQSVKIYQRGSQVKGGREGKEEGKKSNKFRGRLADIMSICHLAPRAE